MRRGRTVLAAATLAASCGWLASCGATAHTARHDSALCAALSDIAITDTGEADIKLGYSGRYAAELEAAGKAQSTPAQLRPAVKTVAQYFQVLGQDFTDPTHLATDVVMSPQVSNASAAMWQYYGRSCGAAVAGGGA